MTFFFRFWAISGGAWKFFLAFCSGVTLEPLIRYMQWQRFEHSCMQSKCSTSCTFCLLWCWTILLPGPCLYVSYLSLMPNALTLRSASFVSPRHAVLWDLSHFAHFLPLVWNTSSIYLVRKFHSYLLGPSFGSSCSWKFLDCLCWVLSNSHVCIIHGWHNPPEQPDS